MGIFSKQRRIVVSNRYTHTASIRNGGIMIRLTLKKLIILAVILLVLLVWAFFVGVLVGQGVNSAEKADASVGLENNAAANNYVVGENNASSELPETTQPPRVTQKPPTPPPAASQPPQVPQSAATPPQTPGPVTPKGVVSSSGDAVISPQELSFMSDLKDKPTPPDPANVNDDAGQPRSAAQATPPPQSNTQASTTSVSANTSAAATRTDAGAGTNAGTNAGRPEDPAPKATTPPGPGIFDYQYQVAATSDLEGAKRLVSQLRADGLRASMVQGNKDGSKLYRVHVDFRGTPSDTNQLREQLSKFGINRVLLKTKVATQ